MALHRAYLFAPGNDARLLTKVFDAGADAVVLDLEDAVPFEEKDRARDRIRDALSGRVRGTRPAVYVRVNPEWQKDVLAIAGVTGQALSGVRLPKAESGETIRDLVQTLDRLGASDVEIQCTIETAKGVWATLEVASAPRVKNLTFGAADFALDVGAAPGPDETETLFARSRLVVASRVAGIDPPIASVYRSLDDAEGLRRSTEAARRLGFFGRSCIHPRQVEVVQSIFTPSAEAVARARRIVEAHEKALAEGKGASVTADGEFIDRAVVRRAERLLALAESLGLSPEVEAT